MSPLMMLAQQPVLDSTLVFVAGGVIMVLMLMMSVTVFVAKFYKRCPSNRVLVIFGRTGTNTAARVIHGGAAFVIPLLQDYAYLSLELISLELHTKGVALADAKIADVSTDVTFTIGTEPKVLNNAAIRLLGLSIEEVQKQGEQIISGPLRQVLGELTESELRQGHASYLDQLKQAVERQLNEVGLVLVSSNIRDITVTS